MNYLKKISLVSILFFAFTSCSSDDDNAVVPQPQNIVEIALESPNLTSLVAALSAADGGLVDVLQGDGPFTVFAPTDEAFAAFLSSNGFSNLGDVPTDVLSQVLLHHVVGSNIPSSQLNNPGETIAETLQGTPITLTLPGSGENIANITDGSGATDIGVIAVDIQASNGVIHLIDKVMNFEEQPQNIVEIALESPSLTSLVAALSAADGDLVNVLLGDGPFTVLAPTNEAFAAFLSANGFSNLEEVPTDVLSQILLNHVIMANITASDLTTTGAGYTNTSASGPNNNAMSLYFNTSSGVTFNGVSTVTTADIGASNGTIHIVDAVINIPTVVTFAAADPSFSTLVTALTELTPATDFVSVLQGVGPFTVFAPTNEAFNALPAIPEEEDLTQVLLYHVVSGNVTSSDLTNPGETTAETLQGDSITITLPGTEGTIANITDASGASDIGIVAVDVQAGNGVIHVLNKVMIPNL